MSWYRIRGAAGLGSALAASRKAQGLTQRQFAARLAVDRTTLVRMEQGTNPTLERLVTAFSLLGYDLIAVPRRARVVVDESVADA